MFHHDRESMMEMYETSLSKTCYKRVLVSFQLLNLDMKLSEVEPLVLKWQLGIKNMMGECDAAFEINKGNIFILLHESSEKTFDKMVNEFIIYSKNGKKGVCSSVLYLSNEESEFLLQMNS